VVNCTSYNDGSHSFAAINGGDHEIVNCASYETPNVSSFHDGVNDHHNAWNLGISNPQFASTDPAADNFLKPSSDSPLVDAGTGMSVIEFSGSAPDIGAYEYVNTSSTDGSQEGSEWSLAGIYYHDGTEFVEMSVKSK
jgi:hypothetical protein